MKEKKTKILTNSFVDIIDKLPFSNLLKKLLRDKKDILVKRY